MVEIGQQPKFKVGDQVRFTKRAPKYILEQLFKRTRTIGRAYRNGAKRCWYYQLYGQGKIIEGYPFRSYMLRPASDGRKRNHKNHKTRYRLRFTS